MVTLEKVTVDSFEKVFPLFEDSSELIIPKKYFQRLFTKYWDEQEDCLGYMLVNEDKVVGYLGYIFSKRMCNNKSYKFCNLTSWDDGTITDLKLAELLEKYGIKATFYLPKFIDNSLQRKDIIAIDQKFEIGAHTLSQPDLTKVSLSEAKKEIKDSKEYLEELLGHSVAMFCYPYGTHNKDVREIARSSGFIAARTAEPGGLDLPKDPYKWHITLFASNNSPLMALKIWWRFHLWKPGALLDWENRAKSLFDLALEKGGIYHIYGHSAEFGRTNEWDKLERMFKYISNRDGVKYMTNGEIFEHSPG